MTTSKPAAAEEIARYQRRHVVTGDIAAEFRLTDAGELFARYAHDQGATWRAHDQVLRPDADQARAVVERLLRWGAEAAP